MKITDKKLIKTARDFRDGLLDGAPSFAMCAAVCYPLEGYLSAFGISARAEMVQFPLNPTWANHVFLRLPDGRILDPTADQFGLEPVYLGPFPELYLSWGARDTKGDQAQ